MIVVHVISTLGKCGPVNVLYGIASNLPETCEQHILTLAQEPEATRLDEFRLLGINVSRVYDSRVDSMLRPSKLVEKLRAINPDIVHVHGVRACRLCVGCSYPVVATVHNDLYSDFKHEYGRMIGRIFEKMQTRDLRAMDKVVACSASNARVLGERYQIEAEVILNGVDGSVYSPAPNGERDKLRREFGIPADAYVFIATCGCSVRKRTLQLIDAFMESPLPEKAMLYILGDGPLMEECLRHADGKRVNVVGRQSRVERWLACSDRFVSISESEGMPMAALEAASCGLPLILSSIPPHREIESLLPDGACDLVDDKEGLASAIVASAERSEEATPYMIPDDVSANHMAKGYYAVYRELTGRWR